VSVVMPIHPSPAHAGARRQLLLAVLGWIAIPAAAFAQAPCHSLCSPSFSFSPALIRSHLFGGPRVQSLADGAEHTLPATTNLELIFSVDIATPVKPLTLYANFQWLPTAKTNSNPFTEYSASELGGAVHANAPSISLGARYTVVPASATGGWATLTPYVSDLYSAAAEPDAGSDYTHKLDVGLIAGLSPFSHSAPTSWLHGVGLFGTLDYVATGLPDSGDVVPAGEREFLTGARAVSLIVGLSLPIAPLHATS
jgi:hypothetical protein